MSRSYHTDPYMIRAYSANGRKVDADWRTRWEYQNSPPYFTPEHEEWKRDRPDLPIWNSPTKGKRESSRGDRTINHRRIRARERECIAHQDYDGIPKITKSWFDWRW